jgi:hypothetical protein
VAPKPAKHHKRSPRKRKSPAPISSLSGLLDNLEACCIESENDRVKVGELMETVGRRSFGPIILLLGLIGLSPISNIPGVVAVVAALDLIVIGEILIGMDHIWIPGFLARRSISAQNLKRAIKAMRKIARFVDKFLEPRLTFLTQGLGFYALAFVSLLVAIALPFIEIVPLAGIIPNAALVAFGLAITAHDGVWALIGLAIVGLTAYLASMAF